MAFDVATAVLLRPHTLATSDLAEERKLKRDGLGGGLPVKWMVSHDGLRA